MLRNGRRCFFINNVLFKKNKRRRFILYSTWLLAFSAGINAVYHLILSQTSCFETEQHTTIFVHFTYFTIYEQCKPIKKNL